MRKVSKLPNKMTVIKTEESDPRNIDMFKKASNKLYQERKARRNAKKNK